MTEDPATTTTLLAAGTSSSSSSGSGSGSNNNNTTNTNSNSRVLYQAGTDFDSRPLLVFCGCHIPAPEQQDHDILLENIVTRLDPFVEADYSVVLFAAATQHRPKWGWMLRAYRRLDRKYRKNLKSLYVVHPSGWFRFLFTIMGSVLSPKFFRKLVWVDSLEQLATLVPIHQIPIPQPVIDYDEQLVLSSKEKRSPSASPRHASTAAAAAAAAATDDGAATKAMFGQPLEMLMVTAGSCDSSEVGLALPRVVVDCIRHIRQEGLLEEGLFRRSPSSQQLQDVRKMYDAGHADIDLASYDVHLAAALLKLFFRELPSPIIPSAVYPIIRDLPSAQDIEDGYGDPVEYIRTALLPMLPETSVFLLHALIDLLADVAAHSNSNLMTPKNLAIVWALNLVRSANPIADMEIAVGNTGGGGNVARLLELLVEAPVSSVFANSALESEAMSENVPLLAS
ncbi:RhoGAP-domain-containing protein [Ramicandelaber brevisporus]|nr:RhoGAP-domain-containing protein [Ramicandelaber brevisporus]